MADPMWSGGAEQFQDRYPYVWFVMGDFTRGPFYPTDPPRDPGAFYDSVAPLLDFPVLGTAYAPFVSQYAIYYAEQWQLNPPGTSTSVGNPPALDDDSSLASKLDLCLSSLYSLHTKMGTFVETDTAASLLYLVSGQIVEIPPPPTGFSTVADTTRILAALAYVARAICVQTGAVSDLVTQTDLDAAVASIKGIDLPSIRTAQDEVLDAINGAANGINANTDTRATAINANVDAAETAILNAIAAIPPAEEQGNFYPGASGVSLGSPTVISGAALISGPMHGVLVSITATPSGQSTQGAEGNTKYKGLGWLCFRSADGYGEPKQPLEISLGILKPMTLLQAASVAVYCKPGSSVTITPYTIQAA